MVPPIFFGVGKVFCEYILCTVCGRPGQSQLATPGIWAEFVKQSQRCMLFLSWRATRDIDLDTITLINAVVDCLGCTGGGHIRGYTWLAHYQSL